MSEKDANTAAIDIPDPHERPASSSVTVQDAPPNSSTYKTGAFWMVISSLCLAQLLTAIEFTSVSTVLPTIIHELHGTDFIWVGSAYALAATALQPLFGGLATIWGRRIVIIAALIFFIAGSAICGAAQNMNMLIAGRTLQGVGCGGILSLSEIIVADLVPLRERGPFQGIIGSVWAFSASLGPVIGGALANKGQWRWVFYINLPLGAITLVFVAIFLRLRVPNTNLQEKLAQMDWIGNFLVIASTTSCTIALAWAGVQHPWSSAQVLVPLLLGLAGLVVFLYYEARYAKDPVVPFDLLATRTSASGYLMTFFHGMTSIVLVFYLPVFFQASKGASPIRSAIDIFGSGFSIPPFGILGGVSVLIINRYSPQNYIGWILSLIGFGLMTLLDVDTPMGKMIGYQLLLGAGLGILFTSTVYPVLASMPVDKVAPALALFIFVRTFAQTWGLTIGGTVLQNELIRHLPSDFRAMLSSGVDIAYASIPLVRTLPEPLKQEVEIAFAASMSTVWKVMIGVTGAGFLCVLLMKELPMHGVTDENWGFEEKKKANDLEGGEETELSAP